MNDCPSSNITNFVMWLWRQQPFFNDLRLKLNHKEWLFYVFGLFYITFMPVVHTQKWLATQDFKVHHVRFYPHRPKTYNTHSLIIIHLNSAVDDGILDYHRREEYCSRRTHCGMIDYTTLNCRGCVLYHTEYYKLLFW